MPFVRRRMLVAAGLLITTCALLAIGPGNQVATARLAATAGGFSLTASPAVVGEGGTVIFSVSPPATSGFTAAVLTFTPPPGFSGLGVSRSGWTCYALSGRVTCTFAGTNPGPVQFRGQLRTGGVCQAVSASAMLVLSRGNPGSLTHTTSVAAGCGDLQVSKSGPATASPSTPFSYTLSASNAGPGGTAAITVSDTLPAGFAISSVAAAPSWSCSTSGQLVQCTRTQSLPQGATSNVALITGTATCATPSLTNVASISGLDSQPSNNSSNSVTTTLLCPAVAVPDSATVGEDSGPNTINVLANDSGTTKWIGSVTQPLFGVVAITGGGSALTYTPVLNYCTPPQGNPDTFTYTLMPGASVVAVSVTVTCVDDAPTAVNDAGFIGANDVLANDVDPDGGPIAIASMTNGLWGTVHIGVTGYPEYTPSLDFCGLGNGRDSFTYTLAPGGSTATVSVAEVCFPDDPEA